MNEGTTNATARKQRAFYYYTSYPLKEILEKGEYVHSVLPDPDDPIDHPDRDFLVAVDPVANLECWFVPNGEEWVLDHTWTTFYMGRQ